MESCDLWIIQKIAKVLNKKRRPTPRAQMKGEVKDADELRIRWMHCCARE
jgi:hypothetical protein